MNWDEVKDRIKVGTTVDYIYYDHVIKGEVVYADPEMFLVEHNNKSARGSANLRLINGNFIPKKDTLYLWMDASHRYNMNNIKISYKVKATNISRTFYKNRIIEDLGDYLEISN